MPTLLGPHPTPVDTVVIISVILVTTLKNGFENTIITIRDLLVVSVIGGLSLVKNLTQKKLLISEKGKLRNGKAGS